MLLYITFQDAYRSSVKRFIREYLSKRDEEEAKLRLEAGEDLDEFDVFRNLFLGE